ncbi:hypothetical protein KAR91_66760 [Candidatus Pacearchaeota archaeon]|nr:hypothetical protein [Candidatus Pacearchaeota archaeon]
MSDKRIELKSANAGDGTVSYVATATTTLQNLEIEIHGYRPSMQRIFDAAYQSGNTAKLEAVSDICIELGIDIDVSGKLKS